MTASTEKTNSKSANNDEAASQNNHKLHLEAAGGVPDLQDSVEPHIRDFDSGSGQATGLGPRDSWPYAKGQWHRVSSKYAWLDLVLNLFWVIAALVGFALQFVFDVFTFPVGLNIALGVLLCVWIVNSLLAFRRVRTIGYILREDDFVYRRGLIFHRVIAVPYGRLQLVDVKQGPLLRAFGLASLSFVTAAAGSNVALPGLEKEVAEKLRDELISVAESRRSGV